MKAKGIPFFSTVSTEVIVNETDGPLWGISVGRQPLGQKAGFMVWGVEDGVEFYFEGPKERQEIQEGYDSERDAGRNH